MIIHDIYPRSDQHFERRSGRKAAECLRIGWCGTWNKIQIIQFVSITNGGEAWRYIMKIYHDISPQLGWSTEKISIKSMTYVNLCQFSAMKDGFNMFSHGLNHLKPSSYTNFKGRTQWHPMASHGQAQFECGWSWSHGPSGEGPGHQTARKSMINHGDWKRCLKMLPKQGSRIFFLSFYFGWAVYVISLARGDVSPTWRTLPAIGLVLRQNFKPWRTGTA